MEISVRYQDIITIEPGKRGGKPCIRGMRITVYDVLEYLASGMSQQEILDDFPYLYCGCDENRSFPQPVSQDVNSGFHTEQSITVDDILACLSFAASRERLMIAVQP